MAKAQTAKQSDIYTRPHHMTTTGIGWHLKSCGRVHCTIIEYLFNLNLPINLDWVRGPSGEKRKSHKCWQRLEQSFPAPPLNNKCIIPRWKSACHKYCMINYRKAIRTTNDTTRTQDYRLLCWVWKNRRPFKWRSGRSRQVLLCLTFFKWG